MTAWEQYGEKFDALSQREKVMAFGAAIVVIIMIGFTYGIEPLYKGNSKYKTELATLNVQSKSLALQQQAYEEALAVDPNQEYEAQLSQLKRRMEDMDTSFVDEINQLVPPSAMPALMASMLTLSKSLTLNEMKALTPINIFADKADMEDIALYQHGVSMTFTGTFSQAQAFLAKLEGTQWQVYWRVMNFDVDMYPEAKLNIEFYTLSTEEVFIRV